MSEARADTLGVAWHALTPTERDRCLVLDVAAPLWDRATQVRYVHTGDPVPDLLQRRPSPLVRLLRRFTPKSLRSLFPMTASQIDALDELKRTRIKRQLGLENAALLPEHEDTIDRINALVDGPECYAVASPLRAARPERLNDIRALVRELPQTAASAEFLAG